MKLIQATFEPAPGDNLMDVAEYAVRFARDHRCTVLFTFSGNGVELRPQSTMSRYIPFAVAVGRVIKGWESLRGAPGDIVVTV